MKIFYELNKNEIQEAIKLWIMKNQNIKLEQINSIQMTDQNKAFVILDTEKRYAEGKD